MIVNRPEAMELLNEGETIVEFTVRKPRKVVGTAFLALGVPLVADGLMKAFSSLLFVLEFLAGCAFLYLAAREFILGSREFVCVTNQRVIDRKVTLLGRPGKVRSFPLTDVVSAKLCQTAMAWRDTYRGEVLMKFSNRKQYVTPYLEKGRFILEAIRTEKAEIAGEEREQKQTAQPSVPDRVKAAREIASC